MKMIASAIQIADNTAAPPPAVESYHARSSLRRDIGWHLDQMAGAVVVRSNDPAFVRPRRSIPLL
jgi:hypothetical protein